MTRKKTKNQLTSTPMRMPKTRASLIELPPNTAPDGGRCLERARAAVRPSAPPPESSSRPSMLRRRQVQKSSASRMSVRVRQRPRPCGRTLRQRRWPARPSSTSAVLPSSAPARARCCARPGPAAACPRSRGTRGRRLAARRAPVRAGPRPRGPRQVGQRMALEPVRAAGGQQRVEVGEVVVDGHALDAGPAGDVGDGRVAHADLLVQRGGRRRDPPPGPLLRLRARLQLVFALLG